MSYGRVAVDAGKWWAVLFMIALLGGAAIGAWLDERDLPPAAMEEVD